MSAYNFFLHTDLSKYENEWVAIVDNEVVSHSKDVKKVYQEAKKKFPNKEPLITKASANETLIV